MLRSIKSPHLGTRLLAFKTTTTVTPTITSNIGAGDLSTAAVRNSAGNVTYTLSEPMIRAPVVVGSSNTAMANGSYFTYNTNPSSTAIVGATLNEAGTATDGIQHIIACGFDNEYTDRVSPNFSRVENTSVNPRLMGFQVSSAGAVVSGGTQATIVKASSVYTHTFKNAFGRDPIVLVTPVSAAQKSANVTTAVGASCSISTFDSAEAAQDNAYNMIVLGWDATDEQGTGTRRFVQCPQLKPRLEFFRTTSVGPAILTGTTDASLVKNATGDYTITLTEPGARACVAIPTGKSGRAQLASQPTSSAINVLTFGATGIATDDSFCLAVLVYDYDLDL